VTANEPYAEVESVKAVSDVIAPLSGEITAVNEALKDGPEKINEDPYEAWLVRVKPSDPSERDSLLDASAYKDLLK
jgi:glycine cleavage system H protein